MDFHIFLSKLKILGFQDCAIDWYRSFLEQRKQYVHVEGQDTNMVDVVCGAPQGSSSGPLIWLIYTLDLPEAMRPEGEDADRGEGGEPAGEGGDHGYGEADGGGGQDSSGGMAGSEGGGGTERGDQVGEGGDHGYGEAKGGGGGQTVRAGCPAGARGDNYVRLTEPGPRPPSQDCLPGELTIGGGPDPQGGRQDSIEGAGAAAAEQDQGDGGQTGNSDRSSRVKMLIFADDLMVGIAERSKEGLKAAMKRAGERLRMYCDSNKLKLNAGKTHFLILISLQKHGAGGSIKSISIDGKVVEESNVDLVLGIQVSNVLCNWRKQVEDVLQKCAKKINALKLGGGSSSTLK